MEKWKNAPTEKEACVCVCVPKRSVGTMLEVPVLVVKKIAKNLDFSM